jgi:hypothetical protein
MEGRYYITIEVEFNDIAHKVPHVDIKNFYIVKIIIILGSRSAHQAW